MPCRVTCSKCGYLFYNSKTEIPDLMSISATYKGVCPECGKKLRLDLPMKIS